MPDRPSQIRAFCAQRGIGRLVHFARVDNLHGILHEGLLSRRALEARPAGQRPRFNDPARLDGHRDAICLSVEFPNAPMLRRYARDNPEAWVVLCLDPALLWELDCAFCRQNASSNVVRAAPLAGRKTPYALRQMYAEHYYDVRRSALWIPARYPTNPQAEVLAFDSIPASAIRRVCFYSGKAKREWRRAHPGRYAQVLESIPALFDQRRDWAAWRRSLFVQKRAARMKGLDKKERRFTERPEGLPSAVVRGGQRIVGWFQVEGQGARLGRMRVCQVLSLAPKGRHEAVYWFGWFREERGRARLVAMNACRWVAIEDVVPARAKVPKGNWFVTADDDTFAFVEDVPPGDEACARELGARPVGEVVVEQRTWCASEGRVGRHDSAQESS